MFVKEKQWKEAIEEYSILISLKPSDAYLYAVRGHLYNRSTKLEKEGEAENTELYEKAIMDFSKAISLLPDNAIFYYLRGINYVDKDDNNMATKRL